MYGVEVTLAGMLNQELVVERVDNNHRYVIEPHMLFWAYNDVGEKYYYTEESVLYQRAYVPLDNSDMRIFENHLRKSRIYFAVHRRQFDYVLRISNSPFPFNTITFDTNGNEGVRYWNRKQG